MPTAEVQTPPEATPAPDAATIVAAAEARAIAEINGGESAAESSRLLSPAEPEPVAPEPKPPETTEPPSPEPTSKPETPAGEKPPVEEEETGKAPRVRIHDPLDQAFHSLRKAGKTPEEAYRAVYGEPKPPEPATPEPVPAVVPPEITTLEATITGHKAKLAEIREKRKDYTASPDLFTEELAELEEAKDAALTGIAEASGALGIAKAQAAETQRQQEQSRQSLAAQQSARDIAFAEAVKADADLNDKRTPLWALTAAVANEIADPAHPDHAQSFKPEAINYCVAEAKKRLGITAPPVPEPPKAPPAKPPGPASGTRATAPAPAPRDAAQIISSMERRLIDSMSPDGGRNSAALLSVA